MFLFRVQRISAFGLLPFLLVHLVLVVSLGQSELSAGELLAQTHGNVFWLVFYGVFLLLVSVHAPIGLWQILRPLTGLPRALKIALSVGLALSIVAPGALALLGLYR